jgi:serine/threonine protein kinase
MESTPNKNSTSPGKSQAVATLIRRIEADSKAGIPIDSAAILKAHPQLATLLKPELEKLQSASRVSGQASPATTTFVSQEPSAATKPAFQVAGYSIINELGRGGQAIVYLATQMSTGRKRAIKVLREGQFADLQAVTRFEREIATLAALNHPNIVPIIDTGQTADGHRFLVMDFIAGATLDEFMKDRRGGDANDPSKLLKLFLKICACINVAHRSGIFHRDLKPSNILIDERGEPHVLDFGLARTTLDRFVRGQSSQISVTGEFLGSLPWCSPEQAEGDPDRIDIRTDVYSLGVILYQILTGGQFPYEVVGNIRDVLNNILTVQPTPPTKVLAAARARQSHARRAPLPHSPIVNEAIERIVLKALAKKPAERYQTAGELGRDISNYLFGRPTARLPDLPPPPSRRPIWQYGAALCLVAAIGVAILLVVRHSHRPTLAASPVQAPAGTVAAATALPSASVLVPPPQTPQLAPPNPPGANSPGISVLNGAAHLEGADLVLTSRNQNACCFFLGDLTWSNYQLTFKAIANSDDGYSVWFHWTAPATFTAFSPCNPQIPDLFLRQGAQFDRVQTRRQRIEPDRWHDIRLLVRGAEYECYVDGEQWFQGRDDRFTHGRIALSTRNPATRFRDIRVTASDGSVLFSGPPDLASLPPNQRDSATDASPPALKIIDLLKLVDPSKNTVAGVWNLKNSALSTAQGAKAQIEFPYTPTSQYDYRIQLERSVGDAPITLIGVGGGHEFSWVIGGPRTALSGLAKVDGKDFDDAQNPTTTRTRGLLPNGHSHLLVLAVRNQLVRAFVDGTQHCIFKTDFKNLTIDPALQQPGKTTLGLCINGDAVAIQSADVLEIPESNTPQ